MNYANKKYLILGVSKSGRSAIEFLIKHGAECYFYEELKGSKIDTAISEITEMGAKRVVDVNDEVLSKIDICVISPGVPINHKIAVFMKNAGKRIIGEFELGYQVLIPQFVAVTGTNGKTTTVTIIDEILKKANIRVLLLEISVAL